VDDGHDSQEVINVCHADLGARAYPTADATVTGGVLSSAATESGHHLALLTVDDLVALLRVKKSWIYDEVEAGRLRCLRLGRQLRFRVADVDAYLQAAESGG
jgi:excisionase family DNA binding protein